MLPLWGILGKNLEMEPEIPLGTPHFTSQVVRCHEYVVYCSEAGWAKFTLPFSCETGLSTSKEEASICKFPAEVLSD